ncbi:hypothetical protein RCL_jg8220.t1 [Rhizophagus clarus]|uniref:Uncharacterized protein n=1 Tax=Rhizophagus clarus TaxID=94130 RepID=A0A8H3R4E9_9GLOM|nr:hypothetical protein RCL_jg8220.t1 [Rhizophagus clarus]
MSYCKSVSHSHESNSPFECTFVTLLMINVGVLFWMISSGQPPFILLNPSEIFRKDNNRIDYHTRLRLPLKILTSGT